ncbi:MAG TPA: hypothetical protein VFE38_13735 [Edaphobacter sp.]|nr:hypothetical protein [Edaphobacter sp.]
MPTLDQILERLQANLNHYDTNVPSLFCDEHVISSQVEPGHRDQNTIIDSVFRLRRKKDTDGKNVLAESRDIKKINGKPATSQDMKGPTLLSGAFEGGLAIVSSEQTVCMNYKLQRPDKAGPYIVRFETVLTPRNSATCFLKEESKGEVFIDPASMHITHLELTTPHHVIIPGDSYTSAVVGKRVLTVDYAPVLLDGETFWMPSTISLRNTSGSGTFHMIVWSFHATYRNYHRLEVKSRILRNGEEN